VSSCPLRSGDLDERSRFFITKGRYPPHHLRSRARLDFGRDRHAEVRQLRGLGPPYSLSLSFSLFPSLSLSTPPPLPPPPPLPHLSSSSPSLSQHHHAEAPTRLSHGILSNFFATRIRDAKAGQVKRVKSKRQHGRPKSQCKDGAGRSASVAKRAARG
jgi:hypothetical protein